MKRRRKPRNGTRTETESPPGTRREPHNDGLQHVRAKHKPDKEQSDDGPGDVNDPIACGFRLAKVEHGAMLAGVDATAVLKVWRWGSSEELAAQRPGSRTEK